MALALTEILVCGTYTCRNAAHRCFAAASFIFCPIDTSSADRQLYFPLWFHSLGDSQGKITSHDRDVGINQRVSCGEAARAGCSTREGELGAGGDSKTGTGQ